MQFSASIAATILAMTAAPVMGTLTQSFTKPTATPSPTYALAVGGALDVEKPATTPAAQVADAKELAAAAPAVNSNPLTFEIVNQSPGISISISYQLNTYINTDTHVTSIAPALKASASTGVFASATTVVAPFGWAGRMTIGKAGAPLDYRGTKIEGNNGFKGGNPGANPAPDIDVSYVDGFSLPAVCSCGGVPLTGCNKPLFHLGNKCDNVVGDADHPVCVNDPRNAHGPATPFFAPCAHAAYTYDYDDVANFQGACKDNIVRCCIGPSCQAPARQPTSNSKREVMGLIGAGLSQ